MSETSLKSRKVLQVTTFYAPVVGGVETQVEDLSRQLIRKGWEVEVITTDSGRHQQRLRPEEAQGYGTEKGGPRVTRVATWFSFTKFHKFAPGFWREFWRRDFDVIHVHGLRKPELYLALLAAKLKKKKIVVSTHNPFHDHASAKLDMLIKLHDIFFGFPFMRFVDKYFLLTVEEIPMLKALGVRDDQMSVVGNAVSSSFFESKDANRSELLQSLGFNPANWDNVVLAAGRMNIIKGFQNLKTAVAKLPRTLFLIVGGNDGYLDELTALYAASPNVYLGGAFISRERLREFLAITDVFVLPSLNEPFGIVLLEAMAAGCAVVASNVGGPVEILGEKEQYGLLADPKDLESWHLQLQRIMSDKTLLEKLRKSAVRRAKQYDWNHILEKYLEVYN